MREDLLNFKRLYKQTEEPGEIKMKILCNYGSTKYTHKPPAEEMRNIQSELSVPRAIDIQNLANLLGNGVCFRPAAICGTHDTDFLSQQVFGLDFDNCNDNIIRPEQAIETAKKAGVPPSFVYLTFSSTEQKPKFRLIFCSNVAEHDKEKRDYIQRYLMALYGDFIDSKCGNSSRLFFGTDKGILYSDYTALFDSEHILRGYRPEQQKSIEKKKTPKSQNAIQRSPISGVNHNIEAIKTHNSEYLKRKLSKSQRVFDNRKDFFDFIYQEIDLAELLEVEPKKSFSCVLPTHGGDDIHPSASVFITRGGTWKYKCHAEEISLNVKQLIEVIGDFNSEFQALEFLKSIYNLKIRETAWSIEQRENIDSILFALSTSDERSFKALCPTASANTRNAQLIYIQILSIAKNAIYPERTTENGNIIFYMSTRQLAKSAGKSSIDKVSKYLKMLIYHGLLEIVPDENVPTAFLKKAVAGAKNGHAHVSFYQIPSWVYQHIQHIESQGQRWKTNGYRLNGISYEMFLRTEGPQIAKWLYPQTSQYKNKAGIVKQKGTGKKSDELHEIISEVILNRISQNGYCQEKEIIEILGKTYGKNITDIQLKRSLTDILNCYQLKKMRATKVLKIKFSIVSKGYPSIIVPDEPEEKGERNN